VKESCKARGKESARERETVIVEADRVDVSNMYSVFVLGNLGCKVLQSLLFSLLSNSRMHLHIECAESIEFAV